jgi:opacity protein-like surface antigen
MIKRLALLCCILLLPTIAAASSQEENVHYGEVWVGGQVGVLFNANRNVDVNFGPLQGTLSNLRTDPGVTAGAIVGYNFCRPYKQVWERYFGVALDFSWNSFNSPEQSFLPKVSGNQYALAFLARLQDPLRGDERFTAGRIVPFLMAGPAIVWTTSNFSNFGSGSKTSTNVGVVAEIGCEFFMFPHLSIGPSFRYRHVFGPNFEVQNVDIKSQLDQFTLLGRLAYHF